MKRITTISLMILLAAASAFAQTTPSAPAKPAESLPGVDEIIEKYIQASGGKAAIEKITSRYEKGSITIVEQGVSGTIESYAKAPNKATSTANFSGLGSFQDGFNGTTGWSQDPFNGLRELGGPELAMARRNAEFHAPLKFKEMYPKAVVKGKEKVGAREAYVVEATPASGGPEKHYFDTQTGLLIRRDFEVESPQGKVPTETYIDEYKDMDGVKIPISVRITTPTYNLVVKVDEVKHNVPVEDTKFNKPAGQ